MLNKKNKKLLGGIHNGNVNKWSKSFKLSQE